MDSHWKLQCLRTYTFGATLDITSLSVFQHQAKSTESGAQQDHVHQVAACVAVACPHDKDRGYGCQKARAALMISSR